jgi:ABC-type lipoprotein export system ATPase subunit
LKELLAWVGLSGHARARPPSLSGGERQRAALARAVITAPEMVLADEPTGNLDSANGQRVIDLLVAQARQRGALVLIATHNPEIAAAMDRRIALRDGRLVAATDGEPLATGAHASAQAPVSSADRGGPSAVWRPAAA